MKSKLIEKAELVMQQEAYDRDIAYLLSKLSGWLKISPEELGQMTIIKENGVILEGVLFEMPGFYGDIKAVFWGTAFWTKKEKLKSKWVNNFWDVKKVFEMKVKDLNKTTDFKRK
jgi:hypothetical protein